MIDFIFEYILPVILVIFLLILIFTLVEVIFIGFKKEFKSLDYIQNIETKLNIYEQEYNNSVLEDSLSQ